MPMIPGGNGYKQRDARLAEEVKTREAHFAELRKKRNEQHHRWVREFAKEHGINYSEVHSHFNPNACFCDCGSEPRGECEHNWTGPDVALGEGCISVTCKRCRMPAISHDMRYAPWVGANEMHKDLCWQGIIASRSGCCTIQIIGSHWMLSFTFGIVSTTKNVAELIDWIGFHHDWISTIVHKVYI